MGDDRKLNQSGGEHSGQKAPGRQGDDSSNRQQTQQGDRQSGQQAPSRQGDQGKQPNQAKHDDFDEMGGMRRR